MANERARTYAQLTAEGVKALNRFEALIPLKKDWFPIMRRDYGASARDTNWSPMLLGQPVPLAMLRAFAKHMRTKTDWQLDLHQFIEDAAKPVVVDTSEQPKINAWTAGLRGMLGWVRGRMIAPDDSFCQTAEEAKEAAYSVVRSVGRDSVKRCVVLSSEDQLVVGSKVMRWERDEYADFMRRWWNRNPSVMVAPKAGTCAVLPLTAEAAERFRCGEVNDHELNPDTDHACPSRQAVLSANR